MLTTPTAAPVRKVTAGAAAGVVIGTPLAIILAYVFQAITHLTLPADVVVAIGSLVSVICSFVTSYYVPPAARDLAPQTA